MLPGEWLRVMGAMTTRFSVLRDLSEKGSNKQSIADTGYLFSAWS